MIQLSKTAAALSAVLCGALAMNARAQEADEAQPRPRSRPRPEASARPAPEDRDAESTTSARDTSPGAKRRFAGPPGLSEDAIRSYTEIPPSVIEDRTEPPPAPPTIQATNPFEDAPNPPLPSRATPARVPQRPEYVVEPPDLILVEVLEALPGRPISGERLVRPDGRISLGFYGEIPVAGLTLPQIKEKIVLHLRKFIGDEILGLLQLDPETGEARRDRDGQLMVKDPKDTDRVFVDVTAYNSQHCYILGAVYYPGSLPYTGGDTVLDLVQYAGGLLLAADKGRIRLIRSFPKGSPARVLPVDYEEITMGTDSSTNYAILPNDRLVIPSDRASRPDGDADLGASRGDAAESSGRTAMASGSRSASPSQGNSYFNRRASLPPENPNAELERRIEELESKLDRLIEAVEKNRPKPGDEGQERPAARPPHRNPFEVEPDRDQPPAPAPRARMDESPRRPAPRSPRPRRVRPERPRSSTDRAGQGQESQGETAPPSRMPDLPPEDRSPFNELPPEPSPK